MGKMTWADELRRWRARLEITQADAAIILGISYWTLTKYEEGRRQPHRLTLPELRRRMETAKA